MIEEAAKNFNYRTVFIYLSVFFSSLICVALAENCFKASDKKYSRKNKGLGVLFSITALLIPCMLAALRDITVGNDIQVYLLPNYIIAGSCRSFRQFYNAQYPATELLFSLLIYIGGRFHNIGITFFLIEMLTILPIYLVLYYRRKDLSMVMGMGLFFLLFYNFSLSGMRQSIAMSILLLSYYYIWQGNKKKAAIYGFIALLFHNSAILMILIYGISYWVYTRKKKTKRILRAIILLFLINLFVFYGRAATVIANVVGIVSTRYEYYVMKYMNIYSGHIWSNIPLTDLTVKSILIGIVWLLYRSSKKYGDFQKYSVEMMLLGRYFVVFNADFYESLRFAYYFDYLLILFIPLVKKCVKKDRLNQLILNLIILIPSFTYWYHFIMVIGGYATNNYILRM